MRLYLVRTVRGAVQLHSPVFTGISHCNDGCCVYENVHPATREWDILSCVSHTAQSVSYTQPNVCVDPSAWMTRYNGPRWNSLRQSSFHSLRDTTKGNNLCYANEKQNTAVLNWHLFNRSQATNLPFRKQRHYLKAWALMSHQCHKYFRVLLSQNLPFIYLIEYTKNCENCVLLYPISRSACMVSGFLKIFQNGFRKNL
jgi:hypothetical protein